MKYNMITSIILYFRMAYSEIKTGSYIIINKHPCKIVKVNISSTGKHGHSKKLVIGKDLR
jgi:translation elongation factor P/translation initiation factor 5A